MAEAYNSYRIHLDTVLATKYPGYGQVRLVDKLNNDPTLCRQGLFRLELQYRLGTYMYYWFIAVRKVTGKTARGGNFSTSSFVSFGTSAWGSTRLQCVLV